MAKLTTHVLDTNSGKPAAGLSITLYQHQNEWVKIKTVQTNADGRCDEPLLTDASSGGYQLEFDVAAYFAKQGVAAAFLKDVVIRFYIDANEAHYHVPLLLSPFSYSTYRGS